ncbi:MAG: 2-C-methyl-D-erythritol 2,4-cyclodiphosphate synthase, partial [Alphaproteobacteria bacterium]|nr:2-C-methyl-D-erythritol 2,4-cyclodiphosphate synthase [Alphaproteobacteria bacterium]
LKTASGAIPALPSVDTLALGADTLGDTVDRSQIVRVQTPQAFHFDAILDAHRAYTGPAATDDAQIARAAGLRVAIVAGDPALEKITMAEDFTRAEAQLERRRTSRTGLGYDVHRLEAGAPLWLCGVNIAHTHGLSGHSDADVALHALTDALLGAAAEGDIGAHFPPSDPQWRGAASHLFVEHAASLIRAKGGIIDHVDITLICEAPKIGPHREAMCAAVAQMLALTVAQVSIKATTTERLGFTGRGEGIAAQAVATIRL